VGDSKQQKPPDKLSNALGWAKSIAIAFVMWVFLRALLVEAFHITSGSMERTLLVGDVLFVNKALYGAQLPVIGTRLPAIREPRRQEIVIFESVEEPGLTVVKRIIGMPGDTECGIHQWCSARRAIRRTLSGHTRLLGSQNASMAGSQVSGNC